MGFSRSDLTHYIYPQESLPFDALIGSVEDGDFMIAATIVEATVDEGDDVGHRSTPGVGWCSQLLIFSAIAKVEDQRRWSSAGFHGYHCSNGTDSVEDDLR
ncbi:hypothetical protein ACLOJK_024258 [Asimina triloba]